MGCQYARSGSGTHTLRESFPNAPPTAEGRYSVQGLQRIDWGPASFSRSSSSSSRSSWTLSFSFSRPSLSFLRLFFFSRSSFSSSSFLVFFLCDLHPSIGRKVLSLMFGESETSDPAVYPVAAPVSAEDRTSAWCSVRNSLSLSLASSARESSLTGLSRGLPFCRPKLFGFFFYLSFSSAVRG